MPARREREPLNGTALLGNLAQIVAETVAIVVIATRRGRFPRYPGGTGGPRYRQTARGLVTLNTAASPEPA